MTCTRKTLVAHGTKQALAASATYCTWLVVQASKDNVGYVYLGGTDVKNAVDNANAFVGIVLAPGAMTPAILPHGNSGLLELTSFYWDGDTNNDVITVTYMSKTKY
jgi:hypothetical protein